MQILKVILLILLIYFQANLWFGQNGIQDFRNYQSEVAELEQEQQAKALSNQQMTAHIKDLKESLNAIEEQAREEYDLIKDNEVFYRFDF